MGGAGSLRCVGGVRGIGGGVERGGWAGGNGRRA